MTVTPPSSVITADRGLVSVEAYSFGPSAEKTIEREGEVPAFRPEPLWRSCGRYPLADKPGLTL